MTTRANDPYRRLQGISNELYRKAINAAGATILNARIEDHKAAAQIEKSHVVLALYIIDYYVMEKYIDNKGAVKEDEWQGLS